MSSLNAFLLRSLPVSNDKKSIIGVDRRRLVVLLMGGDEMWGTTIVVRGPKAMEKAQKSISGRNTPSMSYSGPITFSKVRRVIFEQDTIEQVDYHFRDMCNF